MSKPIRRDYDSNGNLKPYSRCRKWELQVSITEDGVSRKRSMRYNDHTYREACEELTRFRVKVEDERPKSGWMCSTWFEDYKIRKRKTAADSTMVSIDKSMRLYIEYVGDKPLERVTPADIAKYRDCLLVEYNPNTVKQKMAVLRPVFEDAVRRDILPYNPFSRVEGVHVRKQDKQTLTQAQIVSLISSLDHMDGYQLAILLCVSCGLRRGEVCALTWDCIEDGVIIVKKSVDQYGKVTQTKGRNIREVPMPRELAERLDGVPRECEHVCSPGGGLPISARALNIWWSEHRKGYGLDGVRIHDLRHAYVTQLCRGGVNPRVVQALAGHSDINTTMQIYAHVDMAQRREAAESFGELFAADLRHN